MLQEDAQHLETYQGNEPSVGTLSTTYVRKRDCVVPSIGVTDWTHVETKDGLYIYI